MQHKQTGYQAPSHKVLSLFFIIPRLGFTVNLPTREQNLFENSFPNVCQRNTFLISADTVSVHFFEG